MGLDAVCFRGIATKFLDAYLRCVHLIELGD